MCGERRRRQDAVYGIAHLLRQARLPPEPYGVEVPVGEVATDGLRGDSEVLAEGTLRIKVESIERFIDGRPVGGWRRAG